MAVWVGLDKNLSWNGIAKSCWDAGLRIPHYRLFDQDNTRHNHIRMGFASLNFEEQEKIVSILKKAMQEQKNTLMSPLLQ